MPPTNNPLAAFDGLMERLLDLGATEIVRDIRITVARGTVRSVRKEKRAKETLIQEPLSAEEAYLAAVDLVIAAVEPIFMLREVALEFNVRSPSDITWAFDSLQIGKMREDDVLGGSEEFLEPTRPVPEGDNAEMAEVLSTLKRIRTLLEQMALPGEPGSRE